MNDLPVARIPLARDRGVLSAVDEFLKQLDSHWSFDACYSLARSATNSGETPAVCDAEMALLHDISQLLQDKVAILLARVAAERNRYCKIGNLPLELLENIFLLACENGFYWRTLWSIMKTCKSWYSVISAQPRAYTTVTLGHKDSTPQLVESFALRSKPLPLDVRWAEDFGVYHTMERWRSLFCLEQIRHLRTLELPLPTTHIDRWLLDTPAPVLEQFTVLNQGDLQDRATFVTETAVERSVFPQLFGREAPNLRRLTLETCRLAWCQGNYQNLTDLTIKFDGWNINHTTLDTHSLTIIFQNSPHLESLELVKGSGDWVWEPGDAQELAALTSGDSFGRYPMRSLRSLILHLPFLFINHILRSIELSEAVQTLNVACFGLWFISERLPPVQIRFPGRFVLPDFLFTALRHLSFVPLLSDHPRITGCGELDGHPYTFRLDFPLRAFPSIIKEICTTRRMPRLSRLSLPYKNYQELPHLLASFPTITEVDILTDSSVPNTMQIDVHPIKFQAGDEALLSKVSKWAIRDRYLNSRLDLHITAQQIELVKALCRLPGRSWQSFVIDGTIIVEEDIETARDFVLELARYGVALTRSCTFMVRIVDRMPMGMYIPGIEHVKEMRYDSAQALWPDGLPDEVQRVMDANKET